MPYSVQGVIGSVLLLESSLGLAASSCSLVASSSEAWVPRKHWSTRTARNWTSLILLLAVWVNSFCESPPPLVFFFLHIPSVSISPFLASTSFLVTIWNSRHQLLSQITEFQHLRNLSSSFRSNWSSNPHWCRCALHPQTHDPAPGSYISLQSRLILQTQSFLFIANSAQLIFPRHF